MSDNDLEQIELPGVMLSYVRRGPRNARKVLALHGGGGPITTQPFFEQISRRYDVVAPVHPGFAGTALPNHFDHIDDLVYLYLDLLDALELEEVTLLGFSMGGWVAAELAVRSTARLSHLVLVDSVGIKPGGREDRDIADVFAVPIRRLQELLYHDAAFAPDFARMSDPELATAAANRTALALYTWEPYMHNPKLPHRLHRVTVPTLLLWGEHDGIVSVDYARAFQTMIRGARLVVIPAAGHQPQLEQPQPCLDAIDAFLA